MSEIEKLARGIRDACQCGASVSDIMQQLQQARREGWEQGKAEAVGKVEYLYKNSLGSRVLISVAADAIAAMEYKEKAND